MHANSADDGEAARREALPRAAKLYSLHSRMMALLSKSKKQPKGKAKRALADSSNVRGAASASASASGGAITGMVSHTIPGEQTPLQLEFVLLFLCPLVLDFVANLIWQANEIRLVQISCISLAWQLEFSRSSILTVPDLRSRYKR